MHAEEDFRTHVTLRPATPFFTGVSCAEHENKDGRDVPDEVGVIFAGLCFLLGGDSVVLDHEHTPGNAATYERRPGIFSRLLRGAIVNRTKYCL